MEVVDQVLSSLGLGAQCEEAGDSDRHDKDAMNMCAQGKLDGRVTALWPRQPCNKCVMILIWRIQLGTFTYRARLAEHRACTKQSALLPSLWAIQGTPIARRIQANAPWARVSVRCGHRPIILDVAAFSVDRMASSDAVCRSLVHGETISNRRRFPPWTIRSMDGNYGGSVA